MTMPLQTQKPLTRTESFQRMLDLEKRCRLARLHSIQTSTTADPSLNLQSHVQKRSSANPMPLSSRPGRISPPLEQAGSMPTLSTTIPAPETGESRSCAHPKQKKAAHIATDAFSERPGFSKAPENDSTRLDGEDNDNGSHYHEDDDRSDQSSICQSPSWEGYAQKKKMKKKQQKADHQRRESDRIGQTRKEASNKKTSNRLFKAQPGAIANPSKHRKCSSGAAAPVLPESSSTMVVKPETPKSLSRQLHGPGVHGIGESLGNHGETSTAGQAMGQLSPAQAASSMGAALKGDRTLEVTRLSSDDKEKRKEATPLDNEKMSYPPPSSRSHILRSVALPSHQRRNSASAVSSKSTNVFQGRDAKIYEPSPVRSDGNLLAGLTADAAPRGRLSTSDREIDSYVHRARTQSVERSIKGYMLEEVLSRPGPTAQAEDSNLLYLNQLRQQPPLPIHQRPANARNPPPKDGIEGNSSFVSDAFKDSFSQLDLRLDQAIQLSRTQKQDQERETQKHSAGVRMPCDAELPTKSTRLGISTEDGIISPKSNLTPNLNPAISTTGIFSSIKTRMSRRGSTSGGPSIASTGRSFKERAMGAMHLSSNSAVGLSGKSSAGKMSENASQATIASTSGIWSNAAERNLSGLPKPARLLGELNAEKISEGNARSGSRPSEGSSASSYHEGSSALVSPASTPDTSRPQSIRGFSVSIGDAQHVVTGVSTSRQDVCINKEDFPKGLGIMNEPWEKSIVVLEGDGEPSETILANHTLRVSGGFQPATPPAINSTPSKNMEGKQGEGSGSDHDLSSQHPRSQHSHIPPGEENWTSGGKENVQKLLLSENAKPGSIVSCEKEKRQSVSADVSGAPDSCVEPVHVPQTTAAAVASATTTVGTTQEKSEASVLSQKPEDQRSMADTVSSALPKGATWMDRDANTTKPTNYAVHGRGHSTGAIYLQEVRRSAPMISSPLSTVIRNTAKLSSQRGGRSMSSSTPSVSATGRVLSSSSPTLSQLRLPEPAFGPQQPDAVHSSSVSIDGSSLSSSSISLSSGSGGRKTTSVLPVPRLNPPLAKMLVECCRCKYFHDMPSRVYECMTQPNAVVTDRDLGVSGAITTMVKCPWCSHNMRTQCCAGYAAVVYLKERLH